MSRLLQSYAGVLQNARPLFGAWMRGVVRGLRPQSADRLPFEAPDVAREVGPVRIHPDRVAAYLRVTDGAGLGTAETRLVPPVFYTTWSLSPFVRVLADDQLGINLLGMVHLENELRVHRPIRLDDRVSCRVFLQDLKRDERKLLLTVLAENRVGGTLASESRSLILVRLPKKGSEGGTQGSRKPAAAAEDEPAWREIRTFQFRADLGRRYGLLVGDVNPIHLSRITAQPFGFKRPIVHGFCLKAMVAHALIREHGGGDPARLKRLNIRFKKAIGLPGRAVCLTAGHRFAVKPLDQSKTYADGEFEMLE